MKTEEMIEVMQAHLRGEPIEYSHKDSIWARANHPTWNWKEKDYRIAPPKKRKITMLCYFENEQLFWLNENAVPKESCKRVPSEDKIIEIDA